LKLPQKISALKRATIFNKKTKEYAFEKLKKDSSYLHKVIKEDVKENYFFRNYDDYLVSVVLEEENIMPRLKPHPYTNLLNSKEFLSIYLKELNSIDNEFKIQKIGVFDTETTDIQGYILSYAFLTHDLSTNSTEEIYELLNPQAKISEEAAEVHKISFEDIKDKPTFLEKKEEILNLFKQVDMIVGHNVFFDFSVLKRELERAKHIPNIIQVPIFDTMFFSWDIVILDRKKQPKLEEAVEFFLGKKNINYHNALEDVKMTLAVFKKLLEYTK